jgi:hypothetical protein
LPRLVCRLQRELKFYVRYSGVDACVNDHRSEISEGLKVRARRTGRVNGSIVSHVDRISREADHMQSVVEL